MSVHTLFIIAIGGGVLMLAALAGLIITLLVEDRRANREDREQHGHARPRESWRTRFQAWMSEHYGAPKPSLWRRFLTWADRPTIVPAPVAVVQTASPAGAGTPTSQRPPRAAVTVQGRVCEDPAASAGNPDAALDPIHRIDLHERRLYAAGDNERAGYWKPNHRECLTSGGWNPIALSTTDTGYSREDRAKLRTLLAADTAKADARHGFAALAAVAGVDGIQVEVHRRFADLEVRDQARFARITAGIKAAS